MATGLVTATRVAQAFLERRSCRAGNAKTDGKAYYLFGHAIAKHGGSVRDEVRAVLLDDSTGMLHLSWAGWPTRTTCAHLNAICRTAGRMPRARLQRGTAYWVRGEKFSAPADVSRWYSIKEL